MEDGRRKESIFDWSMKEIDKKESEKPAVSSLPWNAIATNLRNMEAASDIK